MDDIRKIKREIIKSAKRGDLHYYWDIVGVSDAVVKNITAELEADGKIVKSKGTNYKIIMW